MFSDDELSRIQALLGLDGRPGAIAAESDPPIEAVDAVDGISYRWPDSASRVSVYEFDDYAAASTIGQQLTAAADDSSKVVTTVNGELLLWATAPADDAEAVDTIIDLAGSFAGRE